MQKKEEERARRKQNGYELQMKMSCKSLHNKSLRIGYRVFLTKQHLAKLRQRSKEVAADLEREKCFAEKLFPSANNVAPDKEKIRQDIQRFLQLVEHHRRIEKERLQQTEFLFQ